MDAGLQAFGTAGTGTPDSHHPTTGQAAAYLVGCYTNREALARDTFDTTAIHAHISALPGGATGNQVDVVLPWTYELFYYGLIAIDLEDNMMTYISSGCITGIALIILPIVVLSLRISGSQKQKPRREMSRDTS